MNRDNKNKGRFSKTGRREKPGGFKRRNDDSDKDGNSFKKKSWGKRDEGKKKFFKKDKDENRGYEKQRGDKKNDSGKKFFKPKDNDNFDRKKKEEKSDRGDKGSYSGKKFFKKTDRESFSKKDDNGKKKYFDKSSGKKPVLKREYKSDDQFDFNEYRQEKRKEKSVKKDYYNKEKSWKKKSSFAKKQQTAGDSEFIRLNKYIANTGLCSRREADQMIEAGEVSVNGKVVSQLGTKIRFSDKVTVGGQTMRREENVYLLLNKPKDFITTVEDPEGRKTVMQLVAGACKERIYPVGRLDRNTTGLLLFTNDGELTKKLTHPSHNIKKIYHVMTDQNVGGEDLDKLREGFELEDGFVKVDDIQFVGDHSNKRDIGVEIHSGRNRIVRRMFEHLGYKVIKLDRVMFAGLTKKDLPRGRYRFLTAKEVSYLKML